MPPKGYFDAPDLAAQKAMWAGAEKGPKDARGVAIDVQRDASGVLIDEEARRETVVGKQERQGERPLESSALRSERGGEGQRERVGLQERLKQLQNDLREDEAGAAYDEMQIVALQESLRSFNLPQLEMQIRGFEMDKKMRLERAGGYRRQINETRSQLESGGAAQYAAA